MQTANQINRLQVIYRCPWTGYSITGESTRNGIRLVGEVDEDYLDAIHTTDIFKTVVNAP